MTTFNEQEWYQGLLAHVGLLVAQDPDPDKHIGLLLRGLADAMQSYERDVYPMRRGPGQLTEAWISEKASDAAFKEAHQKFVQAAHAENAITRDMLLEFGRVVVSELERRERALREAEHAHTRAIEHLRGTQQQITSLLGYLPGGYTARWDDDRPG